MDGVAQEHGVPLMLLGAFLLAGFLAHVLGRRAHVPRVTILLLIGILAGPSAFAVVPESAAEWFPVVAEVSLSVVGFLLGEQFLLKKLRSVGRMVLSVSIFQTVLTVVAVFAGLALIGVPLALAVLLAGIAPASAPAATIDVVRETRAAGRLTDTVLGTVAADDAYGIIIFSFALVAAAAIGDGGASWDAIGGGAWEVFGGIGLGVVLGVPMAFATGRVRPGELTLIETLGFVLFCGGLAAFLDVSYLLACIALGATVANRASHHKRPFEALERVSQPLLVVFFLLAGIELDVTQMAALGLPGGVYIIMRIVGKLAGGWLGAVIAEQDKKIGTHVGWCLLPQAGVAIGLSLLAAQRFPEHGRVILPLIVGSTFVFEVIGPIVARLSLRHAGESPVPREGERADR